jgi:hypothetical protein
MERLRKLIKEVLSTPPKKDSCNCGCHSCDNVGNPGVVLNESLVKKDILSENLRYHVDKQLPLTENTFRYGSEAFLNLWAEARALYLREIIHVNDDDKEILLETNLGEYGMYEGKLVELDLPMLEEAQMLDGYEVDFFKTKANIYANIEIPSENPTFEDDIQIKGIGQTEEEAFEDLKQNYEKHKKGLYESAAAVSAATAAAAAAIAGTGGSSNNVESNPWALLAVGVLMTLPIAGLAISQSGLGEKVINWIKHYRLNRVIDRLRKDPEVLEFIQSKKPGIQNFLKSKLTDKEQKYIKQISWNKITKGEIYEINNFLEEAEGKKKNPPIGKPKRGGSKKFYVYVRNPKTKKIKKVSFGDTSGLSAKINNPEARRAFAKRHDCANKKDRTKPSYWSCRLPSYAKLLGLKSSFSGFW